MQEVGYKKMRKIATFLEGHTCQLQSLLVPCTSDSEQHYVPKEAYMGMTDIRYFARTLFHYPTICG